MFKFLHAADIHLDSPLRGLEDYEDAPVSRIRNASRRAFDNFIKLACEERVNFIIIAGDLFDGKWRDYGGTGLYFIKKMKELQEHNIKVYIVKGNHDAESKITKNLKYPDNVVVFPYKSATSINDNELKLTIHGQSYKDIAITEDLAINYPEYIPEHFNIGVLHTCLTGREGHKNYAPCSVHTLISKKYQYWALGHVHAREIVNEDPWIVFPGNMQGRNIKELGPKGCELVQVEGGIVVSIEQKPLDVVRWFNISINIESMDTIDNILLEAKGRIFEIYDSFDERLIAIRLTINGKNSLHTTIVKDQSYFISQVQACILDIDPENIWVESISVNTEPFNEFDESYQSNEYIELLDKIIARSLDDDFVRTDIHSILNGLPAKIPGALYETNPGFNITSKEYIREMFEKAKNRILPELIDISKL